MNNGILRMQIGLDMNASQDSFESWLRGIILSQNYMEEGVLKQCVRDADRYIERHGTDFRCPYTEAYLEELRIKLKMNPGQSFIKVYMKKESVSSFPDMEEMQSFHGDIKEALYGDREMGSLSSCFDPETGEPRKDIDFPVMASPGYDPATGQPLWYYEMRNGTDLMELGMALKKYPFFERVERLRRPSGRLRAVPPKVRVKNGHRKG